MIPIKPRPQAICDNQYHKVATYATHHIGIAGPAEWAYIYLCHECVQEALAMLNHYFNLSHPEAKT